MTPVIEVFAQQVFAGLASGAIYGLMALALVVIYQSTHHINFAQGEMATFSTFAAWALLEAGVPYWAAVALTIAGAFAVGALIQTTLLRPLAGSPASRRSSSIVTGRAASATVSPRRARA
jgi:branched-chain amino acid transport system permease protein